MTTHSPNDFRLPPTGSTLEESTRAKLLTAAGEVFAEVGFRDATVREICARAGANLAAVNYHFRDKLGLYREVLAYAGQEAITQYPPGAGTSEASSAAERLSAFVSNYLKRLFDQGRPAWHGKLMCREMSDPTEVLDDLTESFIRPQYQRLCGIVREMLGEAATDERVRLGASSVVGQCLFYKHAEAVLRRLEPTWDPTGTGRDALAAHIAGFALAGLEGMRARLSAEASTGGTPVPSEEGSLPSGRARDLGPSERSPGVVLDGGMP